MWILFFLFFYFSLIGQSFPAVTYDAATSDIRNNNSSLTFNHIGSACTNNAVVVGVSIGTTTLVSVTGVTYGGTALDVIGTGTNTAGTYDGYLFGKVGIVNGSSQEVVITLNTTQNRIFAGAVTFCNVNQSTPWGTFASAEGTTSTPAVTVTIPEGAIGIDIVFADAVQPVPSGSTLNWDETNFYWGASSRKAGSASSMAYTGTQTTGWVMGAVAILEATSSGVRRNILVQMD